MKKAKLKFTEDFPILNSFINNKKLVYFDNAATTQKPQSVIDTITNFYKFQNANTHSIHFLANSLTLEVQKTREVVQKFLKADSLEEIIFTKSATESINLVASGLKDLLNLKAGDEIVLTESEHHANLIPWLVLAKKENLNLKFIKIKENGELDLSDLYSIFTKKTKFLSIVYISNVLGIINPIKKIIQKLREKSDAKVLIDGTQAVAHLQVDVQDLDVDFFVFSGHKIYGPTGIGVLYGKQELLEKLQPAEFGGEMIEEVSLSEVSFAKAPYKFEAGTINFAGILGLKSALEYFENLPLKEVFEYEKELGLYFKERLLQFENVKIYGDLDKDWADLKIPIFSFEVKNINSLDLAMFLDSKGIAVRTGKHCAHPLHQKLGIEATCRASLSFYNTKEEVDYFMECLEKGVRLFG